MSMSPRLLRPRASGFRYATLRQGLVGYWPLNETATSGDVTAEDKSGKGNNLTSNNSVLSTTGKIGTARQFVAANNEFLSIASNSDMQVGDKDWTLCLWFNADTWGTNQIIAKDNAGAREFETALSAANSNSVLVYFYHSGGSIGVNVGASRSTNQWNWLSMRHVNSTGVISLRLNVQTQTLTRPAAQTWNQTSTALTVGSRIYSPFQGYFDGKIDEVCKWSRALSDSELDALYNNGDGINLGQRS